MDIKYISTRGGNEIVDSSQAILKGLADDGGLFVPESFPALDLSMADLSKLSYQQTALEVMKLFFTDFSEDELKYCIDSAYDEKFDTKDIAQLKKVEDTYYLELFHGKTIAFKDHALSILPYLLKTSAKKRNEKNEIVILTATSGDTGKAALAGFADVEGTRIIVFYPKDGVSPVQEKQMVTQKGDNTFVVGIKGNFDDAQTGVKEIFSDEAMREELLAHGFRFSSANSINIGRLVPQIVYYVFAYTRLLGDGEITEGQPVNVCVPTGNFGNILAALYAKKIGVPIGRLICASNKNNVLTDFFGSGVYDRNRDFHVTSSPSMDILVSSNLERLLYLISGCDTQKVAELMKGLSEEGRYEISAEMREALADFCGYCASDEEVSDFIKELFERTGYVLDTHTAVGGCVYEKYLKDTGDKTPTVIASTASPFKFARSVMSAISGDVSEKTEDELIDMLAEVSKQKEPAAVTELRDAAVRHRTVCEKKEMKDVIKGWLF